MKPSRRPRLKPLDVRGFPPAVRLMGIGWYLAVCIVVGVVGGFYLDKAIDTRPIFTMIGLVLGFIFAFWGGYKQLVDTLGSLSGMGREEKK